MMKKLTDVVKEASRKIGKNIILPLALTTTIGLSTAFGTTFDVTGIVENHNQERVQDVAVKLSQDGVVIDRDTTNVEGEYRVRGDLVGIVQPENPSVITGFSLEQNYPNPFNPSTTIEASTLQPGKITITNIKGELVNQIDLDTPGNYLIHWGGQNKFGRTVASGVYIYALHTDNYMSAKKMVLVDGGGGSSGLYIADNTPRNSFSSNNSGTNGKNYDQKIQGGDEQRNQLVFSKINMTQEEIEFNEVTGDTTINVVVNTGPEIILAIPNQGLAPGDTLELNLKNYLKNDTENIFTTDPGTIIQDSLLQYIATQPETLNVIVTATDDLDPSLTAQQMFDLIVSQGNLPPQISIPAQYTAEDTSIGTVILNINDFASDPNNDPLTYRILEQTNQLLVDLGISQDTLLVINYLQPDSSGTSNITIEASDGELPDTTEFDIIVEQRPDAPVINIPNQTTAEDTTQTTLLDLLEYASDPDPGTTFSFEIESQTNPALVMLQINGQYLNIQSLTPDSSGTSNIGIIASDGVLPDTTYFLLTVEPRQDPPTLNIPNQTIAEDTTQTELFDVSAFGHDPDPGTTLIYEITSQSNPELVNLILESNQALIDYLAQNGNGSSEIGITVNDGLHWITDYFTLTVDPRTDLLLIQKDFMTDTTLVGGTSTFWIDNNEYTSTNGTMSQQIAPGTYEINATHPSTIDGTIPIVLAPYYTGLRRPGDSENFEQRAKFDETSLVTFDTQDDTIYLYKIMDGFPLLDVKLYAVGPNGTVRFGPPDLSSPAFVDDNYMAPSTATEESIQFWLNEMYNATDGKLNLQYQGYTWAGQPRLRIAIDTQFSAPSNGTTVNPNNWIEEASAYFPPTQVFHNTIGIEILQACAEIIDIGGDPPIIDFVGGGLNQFGEQLYKGVYFFLPGTKF